MSEKQSFVNYLLQVIGYGITAIGIGILFSSWYGNYNFGIYLGAGVLVLGIIVTAIWYFMKKKEGGS